MQAIADQTGTISRQGAVTHFRPRGLHSLLRGSVVGLVVLCALLALPAFAGATTVTPVFSNNTPVDGVGNAPRTVTYEVNGSGGENNDVSTSITAGTAPGNSAVKIKENSANAGMSLQPPQNSGGGVAPNVCVITGPKEVTCPTWLWTGPYSVNLNVDLGAGTDAYSGPSGRFSWATEGAVVAGGDHADKLVGGAWPSWLIGEGGDDAITRSSVANNALVGGSGFDVINAKGNGADALIDCGGSGASDNAGRARVDNTDPAANCSAGTADAPTVTIDDGPGNGSGATVKQTSATFEFSSEPGATFECRQYVDGIAAPAFETCGSPQEYAGLNGDPVTKYVFEVRAQDLLGITSAVKSYTWTVDTVPPPTDLDPLGDRVVTNDPTPKLPSFGSSSADVDHFECRNATDGGAWMDCVSGGDWPGPPLADGERRIEVRAVDEAGNPDPEPDHQDYLIDTTPPDVAFDNGQNPNGAEKVTAHFTESGSGFKSARILARIRNSGGEWKPLPTTATASALSAKLDSLSPGVYEFEARVTDKATNVGVSNQAENGTDLVMEITFLGTRASLGFPGSAAGAAQLEYGQAGRVTGTLRSATGVPLAGQTVRLVEDFYAGSAESTRSRTYRTDPRGQISANLPPGPSREVELAYAGAGRYQPSRSEELELNVNGAVTLKAKRKVRAGRKVKFKGRVPHDGALMPAGGKLVEVQVLVEGKWLPVRGAKRTKPNGTYKVKHRFAKFYTRPARFKFRTKVIPEQGWPFMAPVYSDTRKVKVLPAR